MNRIFKQSTALFLAILLLLPSGGYSQVLPYMPVPGQMLLPQNKPYDLPYIVGMRFSTDNPFEFSFILNKGNLPAKESIVRPEIEKMGKYFLAALTIPEKDIWVNLSPYEQNRVIDPSLGQTDLGKDMLGIDYVLKQLAASLTSPDTESGKKYWANSTNSKNSTNSFQKVWIIPNSIKIIEAKDRAVITEATLKVLCDADYIAQNNYRLQITDYKSGKSLRAVAKQYQPEIATASPRDDTAQAFKKHILPQIEKEVNSGAHFTQLRQIYRSIIMAAWYKKKLKQTILTQAYFNQQKISGANADDPKIKDKIYDEYVKAFKMGVYNMVKTERKAMTITKRTYFSGGIGKEMGTKPAEAAANAVPVTDEQANAAAVREGGVISDVRLDIQTGQDAEMDDKEISRRDLAQVDKVNNALKIFDYPAAIDAAKQIINVESRDWILRDIVDFTANPRLLRHSDTQSRFDIDAAQAACNLIHDASKRKVAQRFIDSVESDIGKNIDVARIGAVDTALKSSDFIKAIGAALRISNADARDRILLDIVRFATDRRWLENVAKIGNFDPDAVCEIPDKINDTRMKEEAKKMIAAVSSDEGLKAKKKLDGIVTLTRAWVVLNVSSLPSQRIKDYGISDGAKFRKDLEYAKKIFANGLPPKVVQAIIAGRESSEKLDIMRQVATDIAKGYEGTYGIRASDLTQTHDAVVALMQWAYMAVFIDDSNGVPVARHKSYVDQIADVIEEIIKSDIPDDISKKKRIINDLAEYVTPWEIRALSERYRDRLEQKQDVLGMLDRLSSYEMIKLTLMHTQVSDFTDEDCRNAGITDPEAFRGNFSEAMGLFDVEGKGTILPSELMRAIEKGHNIGRKDGKAQFTQAALDRELKKPIAQRRFGKKDSTLDDSERAAKLMPFSDAADALAASMATNLRRLGGSFTSKHLREIIYSVGQWAGMVGLMGVDGTSSRGVIGRISDWRRRRTAHIEAELKARMDRDPFVLEFRHSAQRVIDMLQWQKDDAARASLDPMFALAQSVANRASDVFYLYDNNRSIAADRIFGMFDGLSDEQLTKVLDELYRLSDRYPTDALEITRNELYRAQGRERGIRLAKASDAVAAWRYVDVDMISDESLRQSGVSDPARAREGLIKAVNIFGRVLPYEVAKAIAMGHSIGGGINQETENSKRQSVLPTSQRRYTKEDSKGDVMIKLRPILELARGVRDGKIVLSGIKVNTENKESIYNAIIAVGQWAGMVGLMGVGKGDSAVLKMADEAFNHDGSMVLNTRFGKITITIPAGDPAYRDFMVDVGGKYSMKVSHMPLTIYRHMNVNDAVNLYYQVAKAAEKAENAADFRKRLDAAGTHWAQRLVDKLGNRLFGGSPFGSKDMQRIFAKYLEASSNTVAKNVDMAWDHAGNGRISDVDLEQAGVRDTKAFRQNFAFAQKTFSDGLLKEIVEAIVSGHNKPGKIKDDAQQAQADKAIWERRFSQSDFEGTPEQRANKLMPLRRLLMAKTDELMDEAGLDKTDPEMRKKFTEAVMAIGYWAGMVGLMGVESETQLKQALAQKGWAGGLVEVYDYAVTRWGEFDPNTLSDEVCAKAGFAGKDAQYFKRALIDAKETFPDLNENVDLILAVINDYASGETDLIMQVASDLAGRYAAIAPAAGGDASAYAQHYQQMLAAIGIWFLADGLIKKEGPDFFDAETYLTQNGADHLSANNAAHLLNVWAGQGREHWLDRATISKTFVAFTKDYLASGGKIIPTSGRGFRKYIEGRIRAVGNNGTVFIGDVLALCDVFLEQDHMQSNPINTLNAFETGCKGYEAHYDTSRDAARYASEAITRYYGGMDFATIGESKIFSKDGGLTLSGSKAMEYLKDKKVTGATLLVKTITF